MALQPPKKKRRRGKPKLNFNDLPEIVILEIFSFLPQTDLSTTVRCVCKKWNRISFDRTLWRTISVDSKMISTNMLCKWLQNAPMLEKLELEYRPEIRKILKQVPKHNLNLRDLYIYCPWPTTLSIPSYLMCMLLMKCPYIKSVTIKNLVLSSSKFFRLLETRKAILEKRKDIDKFKIQDNIQITFPAYKRILRAFNKSQITKTSNINFVE